MTRALVAASAAFLIGCFNPRIQNGGFACSSNDAPACPSGFTCVNSVCVTGDAGGAGGGGGSGGGAINIAKSGSYTGVKIDPMLNLPTDCPDESLEPNDGPGAPPFGPPILIDAPAVDTPTPKVQHMAICPTGPNPATHQHDVDWFKLTVDEPVTIVAQAFYEVAYGDLDIAIVDGNNAILSSDGSAVTNACTATTVGAGTYYVVVVGADNQGVNRYDLGVQTYTKSMACAANDLGTSHD